MQRHTKEKVETNSSPKQTGAQEGVQITLPLFYLKPVSCSVHIFTSQTFGYSEALVICFLLSRWLSHMSVPLFGPFHFPSYPTPTG